MKYLVVALLTVALIVASPLSNFAAKTKVVNGTLLNKSVTQPLKTTNRLIVKYKKGASVSSLKSMYETKKGLKGGAIDLKLKNGQKMDQVIAKLKKDPKVDYVEPNYKRKVSVQPNDYYYSLQWGLSKINAPAGWDIETGASNTVTIAIVDTGVDLSHPDLSGKIVEGIDIANGDSIPQDDNGHGTHVAGIAAASSNNGSGVAGVSWNAKIMPIKVLDADGGGYDSWVAEGIRQATDRGADIINMSLGGAGYSETLKQATDYAIANDVVVVAASGNSGDSTMNYPAGNEGVLGVGATDDSDTVADFSTYNSSVDVSAPGVDIASTYWYYGQHVYAYLSGTSMATPHVAGLAALIQSRWPTYNASQVMTRITDVSDDLGAYGRDNYYGAGRINVYNSLNANLSVASANVKSTLGIGQKTILRGSIRPGSSGRAVKIYHRSLNAKAYSLYKTTSTDGSGAFAVTIKPKKNTYYKVLAEASGDYTATQKIVKVNVKPKLSYKVKRVSSKQVKVWGSINLKAKKVIRIKMVVKGKWRTVKAVVVKGGKFSTLVNGGRPARIKIILPGNKNFISVKTREKKV